MLDNVWRDLRYTFRMFARSPGFTAIIVITLGLGIAANTAVFSVVSAILLRPLPGISEPNRLVSLYRVQNGQTFDNMGYPDYRDYRGRSQSLAGIAAHFAVALNFNSGTPERLIGDLVTGNYFDLLGVRPAAGRLLVEDDDSAAVIGYGLIGKRHVLDFQEQKVRIVCRRLRADRYYAVRAGKFDGVV